jgi:hypothetical protein
MVVVDVVVLGGGGATGRKTKGNKKRKRIFLFEIPRRRLALRLRGFADIALTDRALKLRDHVLKFRDRVT